MEMVATSEERPYVLCGSPDSEITQLVIMQTIQALLSFPEVLGHPGKSIIMKTLNSSVFPERVTVSVSSLSTKYI